MSQNNHVCWTLFIMRVLTIVVDVSAARDDLVLNLGDAMVTSCLVDV